MITTRLINQQQARRELRNAMADMGGDSTVFVGIHEGAGIHTGDSNLEAQLTVAEIGAKNHFGIGVPARPWLDVGVEKSRQDIDAVVRRGVPRGATPEQLLEAIGITAVDGVKEWIVELDSPPNSARTIARKKSANPLVDTGEMRNSVTYEVSTESADEGIL